MIYSAALLLFRKQERNYYNYNIFHIEMKKKSDLEQHIGKFSIIDKLSEELFIPSEWKYLVDLSSKERVKAVIDLWKVNFQAEFSVLLEAFRKHLISIELIGINNFVKMLYIFQNPKGDYLHYIGEPPLLPHQQPKTISGFNWPVKFLDFYTQVHNGWYEIVSHSLGLMPLEEVFLLSKNEWGILEEISIDFSLDKVLAVFSNSAGGYLCWNFNSSLPSGLVWWDDEEPDFVDFWDILDEWSAMGIQDY